MRSNATEGESTMRDGDYRPAFDFDPNRLTASIAPERHIALRRCKSLAGDARRWMLLASFRLKSGKQVANQNFFFATLSA